MSVRLPISRICTIRLHCTACRAKDGDEFRAALAQTYAVPDCWPQCPQGKRIGQRTHVPLPGEWIAWLTFKSGIARLFKGKKCGCQKRRHWLNRLGMAIAKWIGG
jgi:hypothetical protein